MGEPDGKMRWGVERRLEFIEFRLFWEGHVNRADLVDYFGISVPQASADLSHYQTMAGGNLEYDKSAKTYVATKSFRPIFLTTTARRYLAQLQSLADEILTEDETWLGSVPPFGVVPLVRRRLDANKLRSVLDAIRTRSAIRIQYQSFSRPDPMWRQITPHALGFDGFRWHARAWCHEHQEFRDFVLARMLSIRDRRPDQIDPELDREWQTMITLRLGPHPHMRDGQRKAIELDFGMKDGVVEIETRVCLSYYVERHLGLDLDPKKVPPSRQQIVLLNRDEVESVREALRPRKKSKAQRAPELLPTDD